MLYSGMVSGRVLQFSTDPNPSKSKSKCNFMTGPRLRHTPKPVPLQLYGVDLPWVDKATHLGHELHSACYMDYDIQHEEGEVHREHNSSKIDFPVC